MATFQEVLLEEWARVAIEKYGGDLSLRKLSRETRVPLQNLARWKDGMGEPIFADQVDKLCQFFGNYRLFDTLPEMSRPLPEDIDPRYIAVLMAAEKDPKVREALNQLAYQIAS